MKCKTTKPPLLNEVVKVRGVRQRHTHLESANSRFKVFLSQYFHRSKLKDNRENVADLEVVLFGCVLLQDKVNVDNLIEIQIQTVITISL